MRIEQYLPLVFLLAQDTPMRCLDATLRIAPRWSLLVSTMLTFEARYSCIMHGIVTFPNGEGRRHRRDTVQIALIFRTYTPRLTITTNSFLYQNNQCGLAKCSGIIYLIDTCSVSAVYGRSQATRADTLLDK
jgi:hypothetical protein